jgi:hypothetical protein
MLSIQKLLFLNKQEKNSLALGSLPALEVTQIELDS